MAESKFLKYQDTSGTGLPDICDEVIDVAEPICEECKCTENSAALVTNWQDLIFDTVGTAEDITAYLNEATCYYEVILNTSKTSTGAEDCSDGDTACAAAALEAIFDGYADRAVQFLIDTYNKEDTTSTAAAIRTELQYNDYYLDYRELSTVRLQYTVPYSTICSLEEGTIDPVDAEGFSEESENLSPDRPSKTDAPLGAMTMFAADDIIVSYTVEEFKDKLIQVRKGLRLYDMYFRRAQALDGTGLYWLEDTDSSAANGVFNLYTYSGLKKLAFPGYLKRMLPQLAEFLQTYGYKVYGVYGGFKGMYGDRVQEFTFQLGSDYVLKALTITTEECREIPITFRGRKLDALLGQTAWNSPTT